MKQDYINPLVYKNRQQMVLKGIFLAAVAVAAAQMPAEAQSLKDSGVSIFNQIYGIIGVCGGIAVVVTAVNWAWGNFLGHGDPKKLFFQALLGTGLAFGSVGIVQFLKEISGGSGAGIGSI